MHMSVEISFLNRVFGAFGIDDSKWNCQIIWAFNLFEKYPYCFSKRLGQSIFPLAENNSLLSPTPKPTQFVSVIKEYLLVIFLFV